MFERLVTGRHESGSYYTPRGIVTFMCRESLKRYLGEALGIRHQALGIKEELNSADREREEAIAAFAGGHMPRY